MRESDQESSNFQEDDRLPPWDAENRPFWINHEYLDALTPDEQSHPDPDDFWIEPADDDLLEAA